MNKSFLKPLIICLLFGCTVYKSHAQISVNINIGSQPVWGPVGYDHADYYYLPDVESYYSVPTHQFIYQENGRWIYSSALPPRYGNYDLYSGYKVVVNRPRPYLNFNQDRVQYARYKGWKGKQEIIRDTHDQRYARGGNPHGMPPGQAKKYDNRGDNNQGRDNGRHDNGNHNGNDNGHHDNGNHDDNGKGRGHGHDD